jgi:hypothetical protein
LDLGLRAKSVGVDSYAYGSPIGFCARGKPLEERLRATNLRGRWKLLFGYPHGLHSYLRFARRHCSALLVPLYALHESTRRGTKLFLTR